MKISEHTPHQSIITKVLTLSLLVLIIFSAWQCFELPASPILPNWDVPLTIPLIDTVYFLKDAFKDNSDITLADSVFVYGPKHYDFDPVPLGDNLALNPPNTDIYTAMSIGTLNLTPPSAFSQSLKLSQILSPIIVPLPAGGNDTIQFSDTNPDTLNPICVTVPIDTCVYTQLGSQSFTDTISFPPDTSEFGYIQVLSGGMNLSIQNNLPIAATISSLQIFNSDNTLIASTINRNIAPRSTDNIALDISGQKLTAGITIIVQATTQAATLPLFFNAGDGLSFTLDFGSSISANEAKFNLPAVPLIPDTTFTQVLVDDSTFVTQVEFNSGSIQIAFTNNIAASDSIFFKFDEFVSKATGLAFEINTNILPHSTFDTTIQLTDFRLQGNDTTNRVTYRVAIQTIQGNGLETVYSTDSMAVHVVFNPPFGIRSVQGRIKPFTQALNDTINLSAISLGSNFFADSIQLSNDTLLKVNFQAATGHPADFHLTLKALRADNSIASLFTIGQNAYIPSALQPADPTVWRFLPGYNNVINFTGSQLNSFLSNFPNNQPTRLVIENTGGGFTINPYDVYSGSRNGGSIYPGYIAQLDDTTKLYASAEFTVPLKTAIFNGVFTDSVNISDTSSSGVQIDSNLVKYVLGGAFRFIIQNKIPVSIGFKTSFYTTTGDSLIKSLLIPASADTTESIYLSPDEAKKFNTAKTGIVQLFLNTGGQTAVFDSTQYIRIGMSANIRFNINPEELTKDKGN